MKQRYENRGWKFFIKFVKKHTKTPKEEKAEWQEKRRKKVVEWFQICHQTRKVKENLLFSSFFAGLFLPYYEKFYLSCPPKQKIHGYREAIQSFTIKVCRFHFFSFVFCIAVLSTLSYQNFHFELGVAHLLMKSKRYAISN